MRLTIQDKREVTEALRKHALSLRAVADAIMPTQNGAAITLSEAADRVEYLQQLFATLNKDVTIEDTPR
jgi:hypothetical protein